MGFLVQPKFAASKGACLAVATAARRNHSQRPLLLEQGTKLVAFLYGIDVDWVVRATFILISLFLKYSAISFNNNLLLLSISLILRTSIMFSGVGCSVC